MNKIVAKFLKRERYNTNKRSFVGVLLIVAVLLFYFFRPNELFILLLIFTLFLLIGYFIKPFKIKDKNKDKLKTTILILLLLLYLVYSYFNSRIYSYDGLNYHIKYMLLIAEKGYITTTEYPIRPYLGEFIFALIYKSAGLRILNLALGLISVLSFYLVYIILRKITNSDLEKKLSMALFISSPTFIALSTTEFKPDTMSLLINLFAINLLIEVIKGKYKFLPFVGLSFSLSFLIKTSSLFITPWFLLMGIIYLAKSDIKTKKKLGLITATIIMFLIPIISWFTIFGGTLPQFENLLNIKPLINFKHERINLERDADLLRECNNEKLKADYSSFIFGSRGPLVLFQPLFYITNFRNPPFILQRMDNPGIFIYCGMLILLASVFRYKKLELNPITKTIFWSSFLSTIVFMIAVSSIFWYLLTIFPFYALVVSKFINKIEKQPIRKFLLLLSYSTVAVNISIGAAIAINNFAPIKNFGEEQLNQTRLKSLYNMNMKIHRVTGKSLILDASEHRFNLLTTFVPNADERIVKSNYYFVSNPNPLETLRDTLLKNNINFIIVNKNLLLDPWYKGCPLQNNLRLIQFLQEYTIPIDNGENEHDNVIFKII